MDSDIQHLEETLSELTPQPMSADLLARLDHAMCNCQESQEVEEVDVLKALSELEPAPLSPELISRLDDAMSRWHESVPLEEKVVSLNQVGKVRPEPSGWLGWKSAATVAILGAAMALVTGGASPDSVQPASMTREIMREHAGNIAPATYPFKPRDTRSNITGAADRGIIWTPDGKAMRCLEVKVSDQVNFRNARGETLTIQQPRTQLVLEPLKVD